MADRVLAMLASLEEIVVGFEVDQLVHSLQTATRAEEAGASDEVVVASLCHDIGKVVSVMNHPRIAAEILRPYVERGHVPHDRGPPGLPGPHYYEYLGQDPDARKKYEGQPWYGLAEQFADEWDQTASTPTTPPSRSPTSSPWSARSSPRRGRFEPVPRRHLGRRHPHRSRPRAPVIERPAGSSTRAIPT